MTDKIITVDGKSYVPVKVDNLSCAGCSLNGLEHHETCCIVNTKYGCQNNIWKDDWSMDSPIPPDPKPTKVTQSGKKDDSSKLRFDLVPAEALESAVAAITFGENKYPSIIENGVEVPNWRKLDHLERRLFAAVQRHLWQHKKGEIYDKESGQPHLAHAISGLLFLLQHTIENEEGEFNDEYF